MKWSNGNDVDLRVIDPCGFEIFYGNKVSPNCGGKLDIDMNAGTVNAVNPIENIFFTQVKPGRYTIKVNLFSNRYATSSPFSVTILRAGEPTKVLTGTVSVLNLWVTFTYDV